jgi:hypothetical protein
VLHRYVANASDDQKVNQLLHFFEMASEFGAAVLLSVFRRNEAFFQAERARLAEAASPPGRSPFDRLDFGVWLTFGQTLAKSARRIAADSDQEGAWTTAVGPAADLVERLSQKDYWHIADVARDIRNRRAHGGIVGQTQVEQWLDTLQRQLIQLLEVLDGCFDTAYLVQPDTGRLQSGVRTYERARRLVGSNDIFEEITFRSLEEIESYSLVFVDRHRDPVRVLPLVPFIRLNEPRSRAKNACYFLISRNTAGTYTYVSYHSDDEPRIEVPEPAMENLIRDLLSS